MITDIRYSHKNSLTFLYVATCCAEISEQFDEQSEAIQVLSEIFALDKQYDTDRCKYADRVAKQNFFQALQELEINFYEVQHNE